jgi:hypothetical protein
MAAGVGFAPTSQASRARLLLEQPAGNKSLEARPRAARGSPASEAGVLAGGPARSKWCPVTGIEPSTGRLRGGCTSIVLTGPIAKIGRKNWGDVAVSIRSRGRFTAGRVRLLPHVTTLELEWGRGIEPRVSKVATSRPAHLAHPTCLFCRMAPAEPNRTLLRGFGVRVVPRTRRSGHSDGNGWD